MLKIALIFHSARNDNLGVGALTVSEVEIIRSIARDLGLQVEISILGGRDPRAAYISGDDIRLCEIRELRDPIGFYRIARRSDLVIDIGAGDSFADIYGGKRLLRLCMMKYLTHLARRPLVLAPQTIGPFKSRIWRFIASHTIRRSAIISTRDRMSTECVRELGVRREVIEASDVALRLPYKPASHPRNGTPPKVGLNVSGLLMSGGYTRSNMFGLQMDYPELMRDIIRGFLAHSDGCELHLVPHVISSTRGSVEDDYQASLDLAGEFPAVKVAPDFATPSEAKTYISGLDFFMGARMHSCIAAFSSGVPVVPMAYSRKFAGLFGSLGYDHTVDCTSEDKDVIVAKILAAYDDRAELEDNVNAALRRGKDKLGGYESALSTLMLRCAT